MDTVSLDFIVGSVLKSCQNVLGERLDTKKMEIKWIDNYRCLLVFSKHPIVFDDKHVLRWDFKDGQLGEDLTINYIFFNVIIEWITTIAKKINVVPLKDKIGCRTMGSAEFQVEIIVAFPFNDGIRDSYMQIYYNHFISNMFIPSRIC